MKNTNNREQEFRPPMVSFGFAIIAAFASYYLYGLSQSGVILTAPASFISGGASALLAIRAANDYSELRHYNRIRGEFKKDAKQHGQARFATRKEIEQTGLISKKNRGIFLGQFQGQDIWYDGENSGNIIGPPGSHKSTSTIIPTLLNASAKNDIDCKLAPSFLVNDPSGELYAICHRALRNNGYDVVVQTSWEAEVSAAIGQPVVNSGLNMYSSFDPSTAPSMIRDESKFRTQQLIPDEPPGTEEKTKFFNRGGRALIECMSLYEYAYGRQPNLVTIHNHLMASPDELNELFIRCMETSAFGGYLARLASTMSGTMNGAPEQFQGYLGVAQQALDSFDPHSVVGKHVSQSGFDVSRFKSEDRPVAVFSIYPGKRSATHQRMRAMELTFQMEMICADPRHRKVIALLDEAAGISYMPSLLGFLNEGRKHSLSCFCGWQDLAQAEAIYGKPGFRQILAAGQIQWASGVREPELCSMLSKQIGTQGVEDLSLNNRAYHQVSAAETSMSLANRGLPLMRDVRTELQPDEALIIYRNVQAILAKKVPYFTRPEWVEIAGKHPYAG